MATVTIVCPTCAVSGVVDASFVNRKVRCGKCGTSFLVTGNPNPSFSNATTAQPAMLTSQAAATTAPVQVHDPNFALPKMALPHATETVPKPGEVLCHRCNTPHPIDSMMCVVCRVPIGMGMVRDALAMIMRYEMEALNGFAPPMPPRALDMPLPELHATASDFLVDLMRQNSLLAGDRLMDLSDEALFDGMNMAKPLPVYAAEALGEFPDEHVRTTALNYLTELGQHGDGSAIFAMARMHDHRGSLVASRMATEKIIAGDTQYRWAKVMGIADTWPADVVDPLLRLALTDEVKGHEEALLALGTCNAQKAMNIMAQMRTSRDPEIAFIANRALLSGGAPDQKKTALKYFNEMAKHTPHFLETIRLFEALGAANDDAARNAAFDVLERALAQVKPEEFTVACERVASIQDARAGKILGRYLANCHYGQYRNVPHHSTDLITGITRAARQLTLDARTAMAHALEENVSQTDRAGEICAFRGWSLCGWQQRNLRMRLTLQCDNYAYQMESLLALARLGEVDCVDAICQDVIGILSADFPWKQQIKVDRFSLDPREYVTMRANFLITALGEINLPEIALMAMPTLAWVLGRANHVEESTLICAALAVKHIAVTLRETMHRQGQHTRVA